MLVLPLLQNAAAAPSYEARIVILTPGSMGSWDQAGVAQPTVIEEGGLYKMWYAGTDGLTSGIGYVVSGDGRQWNKIINGPVSISGPGWSGPAESPSVLALPAGGYQMWFSNGLLGGSIGHAASSDGISWTNASTVLQAGSPGSWDEGGVGQPTVARDPSGYWMWFVGMNAAGSNSSIGLATSSDGVTWTKSLSNPVLTPKAGEWYQEGMKEPAIAIQDDGTFILWLAGEDGVTSRIGRVMAPDGIAWSSPQMILDLGAPGAADSSYVAGPAPDRQDRDALWYSGSDGLTWRILAAVPSKPLPSAPLVTTTTGFLAVIAGLGLVGMGATVTSERFKYALFAIPLAFKVVKEKNLDQFVRGQIYQYIKENPGDYYSSIMKATEVTNGNLAYHLHVLEKGKFIKSAKQGRLVRFYPIETPISNGKGIVYSSLQSRMLAKIAERPGVSQTELARVTNEKRQVIGYNVWVLADAEVIKVKKIGREAYIYLTERPEEGAAP